MDQKFNALCITCYCGISRLLDPLEDGQEVSIPPCPKCGCPIIGKYENGRIVTDSPDVC